LTSEELVFTNVPATTQTEYNRNMLNPLAFLRKPKLIKLLLLQILQSPVVGII